MCRNYGCWDPIKYYHSFSPELFFSILLVKQKAATAPRIMLCVHFLTCYKYVLDNIGYEFVYMS